MLATDKTDMLLRRHGVHVPQADRAHQGIALGIVCRQDARYEKVIEVTCDGAAVVRTIPLSGEKASGIVEKLRRRRVIPDKLEERRTLELLLVRCANLYLSEGLDFFELAPVYLREYDYSVAGARMRKRGAVRMKVRLAKNSHDRGAVFAYRPTRRGRTLK